ncbi:ABC transporter ATP-binding protein [Methanoculleus sp. Wushi-C6]|uniref:ABC transporter ATP-binding protein n=1 Tax=Methanoculleus caldifontis TaxID=2651577 RepID=A0ABU3X079_9EURY|nr:ABC transporter ATP-binding protein [Methanoculleus sp. Wushi-C6]MDV2481022.1 ABC transporter ATP-binding protein [Methanoculleus sp. Wushi-C6]
MPVISFESVTKVYPLPAGDVVALAGVDIAIEQGEFVLIMGPSGSGKSTILNIMGSLDVPTSGEVTIAGKNIGRMDDDELTLMRRDHIGFIFQQFNLIPLLSVVENVEYPLILKGGRNGSRGRAEEVLKAVGIAESHFTHKPGQLSGGQQQRVAIARALVNDPDFLLCDEPTGNLDSKTGTAIMDLLDRMNREEGKTIVMVTHDPRMTEYADRTIRLVDGKVAT